MNLADPGELRRFLDRHGLGAAKALGQHFLVSERAVSATVAPFVGFGGILEIGPGPGVLTSRLVEAASKVVAIELDERMARLLAESAPMAQVVQADVLETDLLALLSNLPSPRGLVGNLPYYITGAILQKIAAVRKEFDLAAVMIQKEVGERILAAPGNSERGSLSVFLQAQFEIAVLAKVPAGSFLPPPKVDSVVLSLRPRETPVSLEREARFFSLIRAGFAQPRKTLANNLASTGLIDREKLSVCLISLGLTASVRPHQLEMDHWKALAEL